MNRRLRTGLLLMLMGTLLMTGCKKATVVDEEPDYSRQLPPGASALRKITDPAQLPDLTLAWHSRSEALLEAIAQSEKWFARPSTVQFFPFEEITHEQARTSLKAFRYYLTNSTSAEQFQATIRRDFDTYTSVGWDNQGTVLFTGYYTPILQGSRTASEEYRYPLYRRPADLLSDPISGEVRGRNVNGQLQPYPTRSQIEASNLLAGTEIVWLRDKFDAYLVQVNGSARITLTDGSTMYLGFAGTNGHEYTSVGRILVAEGKINKNKLNLTSIRKYFQQNPQEIDSYTRRNDRFVFFMEYSPDSWPSGSLGVKVTPMHTLATDKSIFPRGGVVLVSTQSPGADRQYHQSERFHLDQDTGGAIRAAGRGDIYYGTGTQAEWLAGYQLSEGRLYYFFLKPENLARWQGVASAP